MSEWPDEMNVGPIGEWPGALTPVGSRKVAPFTRREQRSGDRYPKSYPMPFRDTLDLLDRELFMLRAKDRELLLAIPVTKFRKDGKPFADAKAEHPGVILSFTAKVGKLSYPCDTFTTWQGNLRAIALALEALRKVDRYGVTSHGEQYRGFLAIEGATAMPAGFSSVDQARAFIERVVNDAEWTTNPSDLPLMLRQAKRLTHPDSGGHADDFQRVTLAEQYLKQNGAI